MPNLFFSSLSDPTIAYCINQNELVISELLPKYQNTSSLVWVWWDKDLAKCTSQRYDNEEGESRGIWRIKRWRLWINQSCFSLGFLSQNSLSGSSLHFVDIRVFIIGCMRNAKSQLQPNRAFWWLNLTIGTSHEFESRANYLARLEVLSCSATASVTLQLPLHASHVCHSGDLPVASQLRDPVARLF